MERCIIGIGNELRGDDGVGLRILAKLQKSDLSLQADFLKIETSTFALIDIIPRYKQVVIIDALPPGPKPGSIRVIDYQSGPLQEAKIYSLHDFDLRWSINYALRNYWGEKLILGIETAAIDLGLDLSKELGAKFFELEGEIQEIIRRFFNNATDAASCLGSKR